MKTKTTRKIIFTVEIEPEDDGRWIAEVPELPGVLAYGATAEEATGAVKALALRVLADSRDPGASPRALGFVTICR